MMGVGGINWEEALQIVLVRWTRFIGLAKKFVLVFWTLVWKNLNKLFGQPNIL